MSIDNPRIPQTQHMLSVTIPSHNELTQSQRAVGRITGLIFI